MLMIFLSIKIDRITYIDSVTYYSIISEYKFKSSYILFFMLYANVMINLGVTIRKIYEIKEKEYLFCKTNAIK